jgi:phospholipase D
MNEENLQEKLEVKGIVKGVFFSLGTTPSNDPKFDCIKALIDIINNAKHSVHIAIYSLTEPHIVDSIIAAHKRGIKISLILDVHESKMRNEALMINKLTNAGIDIRLATRQTALMHNKVLIVDNDKVATGSFNYTISAEKKNDENLVVLEGTDVAADYEKYVFERILQNETLIMPDIGKK